MDRDRSTIVLCLATVLALAGGIQAQAPPPASAGLGDELILRSVDFLQAGDLEAAAEVLAPLRGQADAPRPLLYLLGELEARLGAGPQVDSDSADPYSGAPRELPLDPGPVAEGEGSALRLLRAEAEILTRHPDSALSVLAPLLTGAPSVTPLRVRRAAGRGSLLAGHLDAAVRWLREAVDGEAAIALALGRALYRRGEPAEATLALAPFVRVLVEEAAGAREIVPGIRVDLLLEYGRILVAAGQAAEALPALRHAARLAPEEAQPWQVLGQALLLAGQRDEGREALARFHHLQARAVPPPVDVSDLSSAAGSSSPNNGLSAAERRGQEIVERALARARGGDREGALAELRREIAATPELLEPRFLLISLLLALEQPEKAWTTAQQAVSAFPGEPEALYHRGIVALVRRDLDAAEADLRETLRRAPRHTLAMNNLAVVLLQRGELAEGRQWLEKILVIDPDDALARQNLARLDAPP